jgi:diguanylate cyclase (GGDEF)-like protein/PAS domain S-box-containing protein
LRRVRGRDLFLALFGLVLLALGAWLVPRVIGNLDRYERTRAHIEHLQAGENRLRELVISLRHGISGNYDEGNEWLRRIQSEQALLLDEVARDPVLQPLWNDYRAASKDAQEGWETFKLDNALVRNSLHYFQASTLEFTERLPDTPAWVPMHHDLMRLSTSLFTHALDAGTNRSVDMISVSLEQLREHARLMDAGQRHEFERLLSHARIILRYGFSLEAATDMLVNGPVRDRLGLLAEANLRLLQQEQQSMASYRVGLLIGVLALLFALGLLARRYYAQRHANDRDLRLAGTVFDSSQQGIIITAVDGSIVRVNDAYCRMTGYAREELLGRNPRLLKSGLQAEHFYRELWDSLKFRGRWQGELQNRRKDGEAYVQWTNIEQVSTQEGESLYVGIASDITELVDTREQLAQLAYTDTLTGLPNRVLFQDRLHQSLAQSRREHVKLALIYIDLDNFKTVNDTLGHSAGDELLGQVAGRLRACVRESDTVARLGGDEFALILMDARGAEEMARVARHLQEKLAEPYHLQGLDVTGGASMGITFWPEDGDSAETLLKNADVAMYRAKAQGRNNFQFYTGDMAASVAETLRIESGLRRALLDHELSLHFQPQIAADGRVVAVEALLRWASAELGWVPPARFIPVAERSGLIAELGNYALREACRQCALWRAHLSPELRVAVNISAAQFRHEGLAERIASLLHEFNLPGGALELEVTESVVMEDVERGQSILAGLHRLGCRLAIDDFGTGYSSLSYLRRFQVDVLKIDKSFVDGLGEESDDTAVVQAIIGLARSLRLEVVAEGVETGLQLESLRRMAGERGFTAQGYFFAAAMPAAEFETRYPLFRHIRLVGGESA